MSSWLSWLTAPSEPTKDEAISKSTKFFINEGVWICFIHSDINSEYMRKYLIYYMKGKNFQAISTGPFSVTFQQDISNRRCASVFSVVKGKKRIKYEYYEGDTLDPTSSTSVFFQSILLELASRMADKNMLQGQKNPDLEPLPTSLSTISDENTFMDPAKNFWVAFLRPDSSSVTRKVILRYFNTSRFTVDEGSDKSVLYLSNKELYLALKIIVGYNGKDELLVHVFYSSLPKPKVADSESDEEDEEEDEDDDGGTEAIETGDPDLRKGDAEYFHSLLLGLGRHLAQHELLRTQADEFNKRTALGKSAKEKKEAPVVPKPIEDDEEEDEEEIDESERNQNLPAQESREIAESSPVNDEKKYSPQVQEVKDEPKEEKKEAAEERIAEEPKEAEELPEETKEVAPEEPAEVEEPAEAPVEEHVVEEPKTVEEPPAEEPKEVATEEQRPDEESADVQNEPKEPAESAPVEERAEANPEEPAPIEEQKVDESPEPAPEKPAEVAPAEPAEEPAAPEEPTEEPEAEEPAEEPAAEEPAEVAPEEPTVVEEHVVEEPIEEPTQEIVEDAGTEEGIETTTEEAPEEATGDGSVTE